MSNGVLCLAARSANVERVDALLDAGAIVDFTDKRGYTALMCACENTSTVESARMLVDAGANVNFVVPDLGITPLHIACKEGHVRMVAFLLKRGANPRAIDAMHRTPLHWAALGVSTTIVRRLLKAAPSVLDDQDASGYTPLMIASEYSRVEIAKVLLQAGAHFDVKNKLTHTASELADWYGNKSVLGILSDAQRGIISS